MHDDELDDRWLALAALLLTGTDEPAETSAGTVTHLHAARPAQLTDRQSARLRHPCLHERSA